MRSFIKRYTIYVISFITISNSYASKNLILFPEEDDETLNAAPLSPGKFVSQRRLIENKKLSLWGIGLFSGNEPISAFIKSATFSKWSHVGLILKDQNDELYSFEATGSITQIVTKRLLPHVQIAKWKDVVFDYGGKVAYRQFKFRKNSANSNIIPNDDNRGDNDGKEETDINSSLGDMLPALTPDNSSLGDYEGPVVNDIKMALNQNKDVDELLTEFVQGEIGKPYERNLVDLIRALRRGNKKSHPDSLFCSELTAKCLIQLGYLPTSRLADNYLPKDFSEKEFLPLLKGLRLGKEIRVKNSSGCMGCNIV